MTIGLRIDPEEQMVDPGRQAVFTIHVVNQSGVVDRVAFDVMGSAGGWSTTDPAAVALFPGTDATATVVVTPPLGTALGPVPLGIRATAETSGFVEVGEATLNVGASRSVEAELHPRTATGKRRATSVVVLHNLGNAPTKVQVVASDPDDAIVFGAPTAVQIGPGMTTELPLRMRLPSREKQGATLPYSVLVEGGDTGQSLDGQVRQPARKRWPLLALMMLAGLAVAAFLFLRPKDSVAIKEGKADEATTTTVPGETTTVPGAATTVAGGAPADPAAAAAAAAGAAAGPGGPAPGAPGGGAATTAAPATSAGPTGPGTLPSVTTSSPPGRCPGSTGTAQQKTAQRVICAWEGGTLSNEIGRTVTADAAARLGTNPLGGQSITGAPTADRAGTRVAFSGCTTVDKGVASVVVATFGTDAGRVVSVTKCVTPPAG